MTFLEYLILKEGVMEDQARAILRKAGKNEQEVDHIHVPAKYLPFAAVFYVNGAHMNDLPNYFRDYDRFKNKIGQLKFAKGEIQLNDKLIDWLGFTEAIDALKGTHIENKPVGDIQGIPIVDKNGIKIYHAPDRDHCIHYGKGSKYCISKPNNTMWQSYRDRWASTFYFVFDSSKTDEYSRVVVDATKNGYILWNRDNNRINDPEPYFEYLKSKGISQSVFKNTPHNDEEKADAARVGKMKFDQGWFEALSASDKSKYIGRGHPLHPRQFKYLIDNKANTLIEQYISTGHILNQSEFSLIKNNRQWVRSYLTARVQSHEVSTYPNYYELQELEKFPDIASKMNLNDGLGQVARWAYETHGGLSDDLEEYPTDNDFYEQYMLEFFKAFPQFRNIDDYVNVFDEAAMVSKMNEETIKLFKKMGIKGNSWIDIAKHCDAHARILIRSEYLREGGDVYDFDDAINLHHYAKFKRSELGDDV